MMMTMMILTFFLVKRLLMTLRKMTGILLYSREGTRHFLSANLGTVLAQNLVLTGTFVTKSMMFHSRVMCVVKSVRILGA